MNSAGTQDADIHRASRLLRDGGVVVHATEGVWGLACDPFDETAVVRLLEIKERDVAMGLIVIGSDAEVFAPELDALSDADKARVHATWPGANTWILPNSRFGTWVTGAHTSVACRVPGHEQARALAAAFGGPLISTSANRHGEPSPIEQVEAENGVGRAADFVLPGSVLSPGAASRIRTLDGEVLR